MHFSERQLDGFGTVLNESRLLDVDVDSERGRAVVTIEPVSGDELRLVLKPVGRVAVSLRHGHWDDPQAFVEPLEPEQLDEAIAAFGGGTLHGWEFVDATDDETFDRWCDRLSLDWKLADDGTDHTLDLAQAEGITRHLDLRLWFDSLVVVGPDEREIPLKVLFAQSERD